MSARVGIGYDSHRLVGGRPLVVGGVHVPAEHGPDAHSDGDVLVHAVIDALLGAAALGDIGGHFPDSDERWRDADSIELLRVVAALLDEQGLAVGNIDATVLIEAPRLAGYRDAMRERLAAALSLDVARVSVKATSGEGIGFVGRGEGIAALAVASLTD
ncbi:MAG TPA: 2-C-methyl-D-erythritol 2,4-cyclodiphosphate synthase [Solirubrobacteraceae bacterium]|nr:2-C-methyl-D-erythritol 2,4-cyclodiphosphate synthase [Solirubrobacteraceae bacterium]